MYWNVIEHDLQVKVIGSLPTNECTHKHFVVKDTFHQPRPDLYSDNVVLVLVRYACFAIHISDLDIICKHGRISVCQDYLHYELFNCWIGWQIKCKPLTLPSQPWWKGIKLWLCHTLWFTQAYHCCLYIYWSIRHQIGYLVNKAPPDNKPARYFWKGNYHVNMFLKPTEKNEIILILKKS